MPKPPSCRPPRAARAAPLPASMDFAARRPAGRPHAPQQAAALLVPLPENTMLAGDDEL